MPFCTYIRTSHRPATKDKVIEVTEAIAARKHELGEGQLWLSSARAAVTGVGMTVSRIPAVDGTSTLDTSARGISSALAQGSSLRQRPGMASRQAPTSNRLCTASIKLRVPLNFGCTCSVAVSHRTVPQPLTSPASLRSGLENNLNPFASEKICVFSSEDQSER